jgi:LuxR family transcriptional regulator/LuxR family quorum-sensing system transcriptional regulator CciR
MSLDDFASACQDITRVSKLWQKSLEFLIARGIAMVSYHSDDAQLPGSKPLGIATEGFPERWVCQYIESALYRIDPIPRLASVSPRPFQWSETAKLARLSEQGQSYMDQLAAAQLGDGLALQVYGPNMRNAYVGLGFGRPEVALGADRIFELQCAAQVAHIRYCELTENRQSKPEDLSPREMEVLQWIARGKSNSVIGEILGISRYTVDTITRRIFSKLDVNDRTTAAIRGIGSGLVYNRRGGVV